MREHNEFAASEIRRALVIRPVLQSEYREGLAKKRCSVAELAARKEVQCTQDEMRRTLRTMSKVRQIVGTWDPNSPIAFETFTLTPNVLLLTADDLNPPPPEPGSVDESLEGMTDVPLGEPPPPPPPEASKPSVAMDDVYVLNRNARTLLRHLHAARLRFGGSAFVYSYSAGELPFDYGSYKAAALRLKERGLAKYVGQAEITITALGVVAMEEPALLERHLPLEANMGTSREQVFEANRGARRLLAFLHDWYLKASGSAFKIGPCEATYHATSLDEEGYKRAAKRLIDRRLADHAGGGYCITITTQGANVAENAAALDRELPVGEAEERRSVAVADSKKVFVIHGRNERAVNEMGIFLRSMGLEPVWFRDVRKEMGGTAFIAKIVEHGMEKAQGVLALFTPDEFSALRPDLRKAGESGEKVERWQARPNVQFEAGMAYGRDPDRVAFVLFGDVKLFTDAAGIHVFWPTNEHGPDSHRALLRGVLADGMKCEVNMRSDDWMTAGNFDAVVAGLSGVSLKDPFAPDPAPSAAVPFPPGPSQSPAPVPHMPAASVPVAPVAMDDDEAMIHLTRWLDQIAQDVQDGIAKSPVLMDPAAIARGAEVPESKVPLLAKVAIANEHFGVTVSRLQSGKYALDVGPRRVRLNRSWRRT
jgi:predicted nucleotide-binding protein